MRLGIDGTNLGSGGSLTHIGELLAAARPEEHGVDRVVVWAGREVLDRLPSRPWLDSIHEPMLDASLPVRIAWQQTQLARQARHAGCDLLFVPGGTYLGGFRPFVTISRNMLPFDRSQIRLYGVSPMTLKLSLLRVGQSKTVRTADGTIFLHHYARSRVVESVRALRGRERIIPHGISNRFRAEPREQKPLDAYSNARPFRFLYVSAVDAYKHQWRVAEAVAQMAQSGMPVALDLAGPAHARSLDRLREVIDRHGAHGYIRYRGVIPYAELPDAYRSADAFVFASTCENLPNSLLEAMTAGLPIACSDRAPMPDILGDAGITFDVCDIQDIVRALNELVASPENRATYAAAAYERAGEYTWERCADETFSFLRAIA